MIRWIGWIVLIVVCLLLPFLLQGLAQEDPITKAALDIVRTQMRVPRDVEVKVLEKKESPIPGFYAVRLMLALPDRDVPVLIYVDQAGEKVVLGSLFIKGENVTRKEAGEPKPRKIDMAQLEVDKSPFRGNGNAKVTIVEFSNFQCPYCTRSWEAMKGLIDKYPQEVKYVFKHYPLQPQGKPFEISEMVAAVQEVGPEAFWLVHDFLFTRDGQSLARGDKGGVKQKIEELLKGKGYNVKSFQVALDTGKGKKRVEDDMALGRKLRVMGTPTTVMNGDFVRPPISDKVIEKYLGR